MQCIGAAVLRYYIIHLRKYFVNTKNPRPRKNPTEEVRFLRGAGKETLTPGLILGKDAL